MKKLTRNETSSWLTRAIIVGGSERIQMQQFMLFAFGMPSARNDIRLIASLSHDWAKSISNSYKNPNAQQKKFNVTAYNLIHRWWCNVLRVSGKETRGWNVCSSRTCSLFLASVQFTIYCIKNQNSYRATRPWCNLFVSRAQWQV